MILQEGRVAIVDATLAEAAQSGLRKPEPEVGSHAKVNTKGKVQAKWGYQAFVNCDEDGFIFAMALTPGNRHEINSLTDLLVMVARPRFMRTVPIPHKRFERGWQSGASLTRFSEKGIEVANSQQQSVLAMSRLALQEGVLKQSLDR